MPRQPTVAGGPSRVLAEAAHLVGDCHPDLVLHHRHRSVPVPRAVAHLAAWFAQAARDLQGVTDPPRDQLDADLLEQYGPLLVLAREITRELGVRHIG